jgi:hypothetical protein
MKRQQACHAAPDRHARNVFIMLEEADRLAILFGAQAGPDLDGLARIFESDGQNDLSEWDGLLARDHSVELLRAGLEQISAQP